MLKITVIVFSLRITLRCVGCDMYCISVLKCVCGRGGLGWEGTGKGGWVACWCMWITYRSKCYFLICANVIHRPWAVNWKLLNVTKKKQTCLLTLLKCQPSPYPSVSHVSIQFLYPIYCLIRQVDLYLKTGFCIPKCYHVDSTYQAKFSDIHFQTFMSPDKDDKMYF